MYVSALLQKASVFAVRSDCACETAFDFADTLAAAAVTPPVPPPLELHPAIAIPITTSTQVHTRRGMRPFPVLAAADPTDRPTAPTVARRARSPRRPDTGRRSSCAISMRCSCHTGSRRSPRLATPSWRCPSERPLTMGTTSRECIGYIHTDAVCRRGPRAPSTSSSP